MNKVILALATICCVVNSVSFAGEEDMARKSIERKIQELKKSLIELKQDLQRNVSVQNVGRVVDKVCVVCDQYEMLDCRCKELDQTWRVKWPDIDAGRMREYKALIDKINHTCLENCKNSELQNEEDIWHMRHSGMVVARRLFGKVFDE